MDNIEINVQEQVTEVSVQPQVINVEVSGGQGPRGLQGVGAERMIYVADVVRNSNGTITVTEIYNTTGKFLFWSSTGATEVILQVGGDNTYFEKLLSIAWYMRNESTTTNYLNYRRIGGGNIMRFVTLSSVSTYRCCIEFFNY